MNSPSISIVVLNWNDTGDTLACLGSLAALTYTNFSVIVVDNGSSENSLTRLRPYTAPYPLTLLETEYDSRYVSGKNVDPRHAFEHGTDFILILNDDTTITPDLLERQLESAQRNPDAGVFSAWIKYFDEPEGSGSTVRAGTRPAGGWNGRAKARLNPASELPTSKPTVSVARRLFPIGDAAPDRVAG